MLNQKGTGPLELEKTRLSVQPWHWRTAGAGIVFSVALALASPWVDTFLNRPLGWTSFYWTLVATAYLGGITWGLTHAFQLKLSLFWSLQLVTLPVTLVLLCLAVPKEVATPLLLAGGMGLTLTEAWLVPNVAFRKLRLSYGLGLSLGLVIAMGWQYLA